MSLSLKTEGFDDLKVIAERLQEAGDKKLLNAVRTGMRRAAQPMGRKVLTEAAEGYPKRGGLAARIAGRKYGVRSSFSAKSPTVTIAYKPGGRGLAALERGELRHPIFGRSSQNRKHWRWTSQSVPAGRISDAAEREAPAVRQEVLKAANRVFDDVAKGL